MIILYKYFFFIVDNIGFRRYFISFNLDFNVVLRNTIIFNIFRFFNEEKSDLKKLFDLNEGNVDIVIDMWIISD